MRASGRYAAFEGHESVNSIMSRLGAVLVAAAIVAGCGGLDSPDLNTGQVSGRLTGDFKKGVAYAYALGAPGTKVPIADDGSYTLSRVPVASNGNVPSGKAQVVLFDGDARADIQIADVKPASHTQADPRDASSLAHARTVITAARCTGGASGSNTVYTVDGAALKDDAKGDVAKLFPLPPGAFKVRAKLSGFKEKVQDVDLSADADQQIEMDLEIDDEDEHRGCIANGCTGGRECDDHDGYCYACTLDAQCAAGQKCDYHVCLLESGLRPACASCTADQDCKAPSSSSLGKCVVDASGAGNVCTNTCAANADCPSGFACVAGVCAPPAGCSAYFQVFGSVCLQPSQCALADAGCFGASGSAAGYCTSRCGSNDDCPGALGFSCKSTSIGNLCSR